MLALVRLVGQVQKTVQSAPTADDVIRRLNRLLAGRGIKATRLRFAPRSLVRRFSAERLSHAEARRATKRWGRLDDRTVEVWLRRRRRTLGSLVVTVADFTPARQAVIEVVAEGIIVAAHDLLMAEAHEAAAEWKAHADAQRRIIALACAAHDDEVRNIRAGLVASDDEHGRDTSVAVADLLDVLDSLELRVQWGSVAADLLPLGPRALPSSLRRLAAWLDDRIEVTVSAEVRGRPRPVRPAVARALYAVAYECLGVVQDLRSCSRARVMLQFRPDDIVLVVRDNGAGQRPRQFFGDTLAPLLRPVDGDFDVRPLRTGGMVVSATVPEARSRA